MAKIGLTSDRDNSHRYSADLDSVLSRNKAFFQQYPTSPETVNERWSVTLCQYNQQPSRILFSALNPDEEHCGELMPQISAHNYDRAYYGSTPSQDSLSIRSRFSTPISRAQSPESDEAYEQRCTLCDAFAPQSPPCPSPRSTAPTSRCMFRRRPTALSTPAWTTKPPSPTSPPSSTAAPASAAPSECPPILSKPSRSSLRRPPRAARRSLPTRLSALSDPQQTAPTSSTSLAAGLPMIPPIPAIPLNSAGNPSEGGGVPRGSGRDGGAARGACWKCCWRCRRSTI